MARALILPSLFAILVACRVGLGEPSDVATTPSGANESQINDELTVRRIAENAYVVVHGPFYDANVLVAKMPDGAVVICSSPYETVGARALVNWVRATLHPTRIVAINTHFHFDGTGGNEAYRELGVEIVSSDHTKALLLDRGAKLRSRWAEDMEEPKRKRVMAMQIVPADRTFPEHEGLVLRFGAEEVRVLYPGPGHSPDNLVVHFPSRGILFGGCMIKASRSIGYLGDADLDHWSASVDVAKALRPRIVVPGHGAVSGPDLFDLTQGAIKDALAKRQDAGAPLPPHS